MWNRLLSIILRPKIVKSLDIFNTRTKMLQTSLKRILPPPLTIVQNSESSVARTVLLRTIGGGKLNPNSKQSIHFSNLIIKFLLSKGIVAHAL